MRDVTNGSTLPFKIRPGAPNDALTVQAGGRIGMGTNNPDSSSRLHLRTTNSVAEIRLETTVADGTPRLRFVKPANNVPPNNEVAGAWSVGTKSTGTFSIERDDMNILRIRHDNFETILDFDLDVRGSMEVVGDLDVGGTLTTMSDKDHKDAIEFVDPEQVLEKLVEMPIHSWEFQA